MCLINAGFHLMKMNLSQTMSNIQKKVYQFVGIFFLKPTPSVMPTSEPSLQQRFLSLHPSLQRICGQVKFPTDNRKEMLDRRISSNNNVFGASGASLKHDHASHAWIISSGDPSNIENPNIHKSGSGPVHGYYPNLSSARGELQGITALTIIFKLTRLLHPIRNSNYSVR
jgi:hypothetical protein